jgi:hypothetical protein
VHFDAHPVIDGDRAVQFLSALIGVWPNTTIYMPGKEDVAIEVGTVLIFSGSKAHGGSAYKTGNRRLHVYFFSESSLHPDIAPLEDYWKHFALVDQLKADNLTPQQKKKMEEELLNNLTVLDYDAKNSLDTFEQMPE